MARSARRALVPTRPVPSSEAIRPSAGEGRGWIGLWLDQRFSDSRLRVRRSCVDLRVDWHSEFHHTLGYRCLHLRSSSESRNGTQAGSHHVANAGDRALARDPLAAEATAIWVGVAHARVIVRIAIERVRTALLTLARSAAGIGAPHRSPRRQVQDSDCAGPVEGPFSSTNKKAEARTSCVLASAMV